ncbi:MAG: antitoxin VbhA family protein [Oscillospiraceae bacterium]|nr:antitoxin VbhA family protein [Oscillospiraceae bacterium]
MNDTTARALRNAIASAKMEGIDFSADILKTVTDYAEKKINFDELMKIVSSDCKRV